MLCSFLYLCSQTARRLSTAFKRARERMIAHGEQTQTYCCFVRLCTRARRPCKAVVPPSSNICLDNVGEMLCCVGLLWKKGGGDIGESPRRSFVFVLFSVWVNCSVYSGSYPFYSISYSPFHHLCLSNVKSCQKFSANLCRQAYLP